MLQKKLFSVCFFFSNFGMFSETYGSIWSLPKYNFRALIQYASIWTKSCLTWRPNSSPILRCSSLLWIRRLKSIKRCFRMRGSIWEYGRIACFKLWQVIWSKTNAKLNEITQRNQLRCKPTSCRSAAFRWAQLFGTIRAQARPAFVDHHANLAHAAVILTAVGRHLGCEFRISAKIIRYFNDWMEWMKQRMRWIWYEQSPDFKQSFMNTSPWGSKWKKTLLPRHSIVESKFPCPFSWTWLPVFCRNRCHQCDRFYCCRPSTRSSREFFVEMHFENCSDYFGLLPAGDRTQYPFAWPCALHRNSIEFACPRDNESTFHSRATVGFWIVSNQSAEHTKRWNEVMEKEERGKRKIQIKFKKWQKKLVETYLKPTKLIETHETHHILWIVKISTDQL